MDFSSFTTAVSACIRFKPDREAVEEELTAHLEDRRDAYLARGMTRQEAEDLAMRSMGDPKEIGRALDKAHSPWLGWFQVWFGRVVLAVLAFTAVIAIQFVTGAVSDLLTPDSVAQYQNYPWSHLSTENIITDYRADTVWEYDGYTFTVQRVAVACSAYTDSLTMYYRIKTTNRNPWLRGPDFEDWLWAEDDLGNYYCTWGEIEVENGRPLSQNGYRHNVGNVSQTNVFSSYYDLWVQGIDPEVSEITLCFDRYGDTAILLTVPLKGGSGSG